MSGDLSWMTMTIPASIVIVMSVIYYVTPTRTRRDIYFAVTVDPAFPKTAEAKRILTDYHAQVGAHTLIAIAFSIFVRNGPIALLLAPFWLIGGATVAFLLARRKVLPHAAKPEAIREASLAPGDERLPGGWLAQLVPFIVLGGAAVYLHLHWGQIPPRFPIHWDLHGDPNGWSTRTLGGVYFPLGLGAGACGTLVVLALLILHRSPRLHATGTMARSEGRFRHVNLWILLATEFFIASVFSWVSLLPLRARPMAGPAASSFFVIVVALALVMGTTAVFARIGQGGTRIEAAAGQRIAEVPKPVGDGTADRFWKGGLFYFNRDDPAFLVEKRFGFGYSVNFAHPVAWLILGGLLALPFLIPYLVKTFVH